MHQFNSVKKENGENKWFKISVLLIFAQIFKERNGWDPINHVHSPIKTSATLFFRSTDTPPPLGIIYQAINTKL